MSNNTIEHDPEVCGINREHSCPACQAECERLLATPSPEPGSDIDLWTWCIRHCDALAHLRGQLLLSDRPTWPTASDGPEAILISMLCRRSTRDIVLALLRPGIEAITRRAAG